MICVKKSCVQMWTGQVSTLILGLVGTYAAYGYFVTNRPMLPMCFAPKNKSPNYNCIFFFTLLLTILHNLEFCLSLHLLRQVGTMNNKCTTGQ